MKCQFFPFFGVLFALAFAPGLTSVRAAGETVWILQRSGQLNGYSFHAARQ